MKYVISGTPNAPTLVCIPGLLGGMEDFSFMKEAWEQHFNLILLDPNAERRESAGVKGLTEDDLRDVNLDINKTADEIRDILVSLNRKNAFLVGVSLGGKMVFDFAIRHPTMFAGGLVTDVGPVPVTDTDLFHYVNNAVLETNLDLPWAELKKELAARIPERALRSLIQTQLHYPNRVPPAEWRTGMMNFQQMLEMQSANDQLSGMNKIDSVLVGQGAKIVILKAATASAIKKQGLAEVEKLKSIVIDHVSDANHFLHITHRPLIQSKMLEFVKPHHQGEINKLDSKGKDELCETLPLYQVQGMERPKNSFTPNLSC